MATDAARRSLAGQDLTSNELESWSECSRSIVDGAKMSGKTPKRKSRPGIDEYGRTPLHYACSTGNGDLCAELLAAGALPNAQDDNGWAPLHFAAQAQSEQVTSLLLRAGAHTE